MFNKSDDSYLFNDGIMEKLTLLPFSIFLHRMCIIYKVIYFHNSFSPFILFQNPVIQAATSHNGSGNVERERKKKHKMLLFGIRGEQNV